MELTLEEDEDLEPADEPKKAAELDDDFSAWVAETADVDRAAGPVTGFDEFNDAEDDDEEVDDGITAMLLAKPDEKAESLAARSLLLGRGQQLPEDAAVDDLGIADDAHPRLDEDKGIENDAEAEIEDDEEFEVVMEDEEEAEPETLPAPVRSEVLDPFQEAAEEALMGLDADIEAAEAAEREEEEDENEVKRALLRGVDAEIWDVDELDEQAEKFGEEEAKRPKAPKPPPVMDEEVVEVESGGEEELPRQEENSAVPTLKMQPKCKQLPKRPASGSSEPGRQAKAARTEGGSAYNLKRVVVNFIAVGREYARTVLQKDSAENHFDWEGVRTSVQHLASELGLEVLGVVPRDFVGEDSWSNSVSGVPEDVRTFCESVEEHSSSSSSAHTVMKAHRENCRFVDGEDSSAYENDGFCNTDCLAWLASAKETLRISYKYDAEIGSFLTEGVASTIPSGSPSE